MNPGQGPPVLRPPPVRPGDTNVSTDTGAHRNALPLILGLLVVVALVVVFVLPAQLNKHTESGNETTIDAIHTNNMLPSRSEPERAIQQAPIAPPQSPVAQKDAQQALQVFLRLRAHPLFKDAHSWAKEQWQSALEQADEGDMLFGKGKFKSAKDSYEGATGQLNSLLEAQPHILGSTLNKAEDLLQENAIEPAIEAFEKVLLMEQGHLQAQAGLSQAKVRKAVLQEMRQGDQALRDNQLQTAKTAYMTALSLDPGYQPADVALQAIQDTLDNQAYQSAMSIALVSVQSGQFSKARQALDAASKIRPQSPEIADARQSLKLAIKQARLNRLRRESDKMSSGEQWVKAAELYKQALAIETQTGFASSGLAHAQARIELHKQLDHYLNNPQRLSSNEPLSNAKALLGANASPPQNEPQLLAKLNALEKQLQLASVPVSLVIESDALTKISIYHIGQLGLFERKQLSLRPGRYTLVGSRPGYRDVRTVIELRPNMPLQIQLKCEEMI